MNNHDHHAMNADAEVSRNGESGKCVALIAGDSMSRHTQPEFVSTIVSEIVSEQPHLFGGSMVVQGYTPPGSVGHGQGMFHITIHAEPHGCTRFLLIFGVKQPRTKGHLREWCNEGSWSDDCGGKVAYVAGWDEAWLLVCAVGQKLRIKSIDIIYGT